MVAGHGNKMEDIKSLIEQEKISNVYMYDFLRGNDFKYALEISDCALISLEKGLTGLCVPSKTYSYMMQGIPLLAIMDQCDIVKDIQSGAGYWVRNGEVQELTLLIQSMNSNPHMLEDIRRKCREIYLQKYTTEICTNKYVMIFRKLL